MTTRNPLPKSIDLPGGIEVIREGRTLYLVDHNEGNDDVKLDSSDQIVLKDFINKVQHPESWL